MGELPGNGSGRQGGGRVSGTERRLVTIGSIYHLAGEAGWQPARREAPDYILDVRGKVKVCEANGRLWLTRHGYGDRSKFNDFSGAFEIDNEEITDDVLEELQIEMQKDEKIRWDDSSVQRGLRSICRKNRHHPVREYLESLTWDGTPRIEQLLARGIPQSKDDIPGIVTVKDYDPKYHPECFRVFMLQAVKRVLSPGCRADSVLVFVGEEGIFKSSFFRRLVPNELWFGDDLGAELENKDALMALRGRWIIEFAELGRTEGKSEDAIKRFLNRQQDEYRLPWGKGVSRIKRQCVLAMTTNRPVPFTGHDGERRKLPVRVSKIDIDAVEGYRDELWAEAYLLVKAGETTQLNPKLEGLAKERQAEATIQDSLIDMVEMAVATFPTPFTNLEIINQLTEMGYMKKEGILSVRGLETRLGNVLFKLGYTPKRPWNKELKKYETRRYYTEEQWLSNLENDGK